MNISSPWASRRTSSTVRLASCLVLCLLAGRAGADATIQLPASVAGNVGAFIQVPATTTGTAVKWFSVDGGLNLFPTNLLKDTKVAVVTSPTAGSFRLLAWTSDQTGPSDAAVCIVTIGTPGPPPSPVDALTQALQTAYGSDTSPTKAAKKTLLQGLYFVAPKNPLSRTDLATIGDVLKVLEADRRNVMQDADLASEQRVIDAYLSAKFAATQPLDPPTRAAAGAEFVKVANALGSVN
jgi:hypothetical protein